MTTIYYFTYELKPEKFREKLTKSKKTTLIFRADGIEEAQNRINTYITESPKYSGNVEDYKILLFAQKTYSLPDRLAIKPVGRQR